MKLKGIFPALSLAALMALGACGGGGGDDSGGSAAAVFNIQGQRTLEAQEGSSIAVTATAVSQASSSGLSGNWIIAGGTSLNEAASPGPGRFSIRNADCAENAQSGTGMNADNLPTVGRFTCTVFLEFPALDKPQEVVNLTFQSTDGAGNGATANFSVNVFRTSVPGFGSPVALSLSTQTPTGTSTGGSVNLEEGQIGSFRINATSRLGAVTGATVSQIAGFDGVTLSNQDCAVSTVTNGSFSCVVGFTTPSSVANFSSYEFQIQAVDSQGSVGSTTVRLVVSPKNAGTLSAGVSSTSSLNNPIRFEPGQVRNLECFSTGGVGPFQYRWTVTRPAGNASAPEILTAQQDDQVSRTSTLSLTLPNTEVTGVYTATCRVSDVNGQMAAAPSVFFTLQRSGFFLEVSPAAQNEAFAGGDTISLRAAILDLERTPVGDPQNYRISFVPNNDLAAFGQAIGTGLNYDVIAPRFQGTNDRVFSVSVCAAKTSEIPSGVTNVCTIERSAKLIYTFKVDPEPIRNQEGTIADAELVGTSNVFAPGDTVMLTGAGTQAVNGANIADVFYYWTITPSNSGLTFNNSRLRDPSINLPAGVTGSFTATLFTSLQNTNSATPPPADVRSEDSVSFTVNANNNVVLTADAGVYAPVTVTGGSQNFVLSGAGTMATNQTASQTVNYEWFQITAGAPPTEMQCSNRTDFNAFVSARNATTRVALTGATTVFPAFDIDSLTPNRVLPDQRVILNFLLRANVTGTSGEVTSDCAVATVTLEGQTTVQADAGEAQAITAPPNAPTSFLLDGTGSTVGGSPVSPNGDAPAGFMVSWSLVEARDQAGTLFNPTPVVNINNQTRLNASVILSTPAIYLFDLIIFSGQERKANGDPYDLTDPMDRIQFGIDFPSRRQTVSKALSN